MATREELNAIDQALASINDRVRDISINQRDIDLGSRFRDAAEQAAAVFTTDRIGAFKGAIKDAGKAIILFAKQIKEAKTSTVLMNGAFMGFLGGFGLAKTSLSLFGGLLSSVFNIGRSVVGAFTRTIGSLFGFFYGALKSGGGGSGLFELLQEMRTSFGGLEDYSNQAIFSIADNLRALPRRLNVVGWSFTKLIENAKKYADTLGPLFMDFARYQFTPATALLLHGMGATEEQQVDLVRSSRAMGVSLNDMMMDIARNGAAVGQAIGESAKVIQKEMLAARQNIQVFGSVSDEELSLTVGRLRTLGMEAKDVANIFNAFDTFQGAAEAASKLAAAFGMQIDVFRMVNEENPASRLDMLRNEMFKTGRSAEQLSRRELMLFSNILGESDLRLVQMALSAENAGMSMEDIAKAAEESGEKTKPLEEVLSDLSNQIARMIGSGGSYDTFLGAMNYGIERGIKRWMWMNQLTFSYRRALHETAWGFRRLAYQFMQYFPGIRDVAKGFVDLFNPRRIREFFRTLTGSTFDYLDGSGGKDGLIYRFLSTDNFDPKAFFENVFSTIMQWAGPNGAVVMNIMNGLKTIGNAILVGIRELLTWVSEKIFGDPNDGIGAMLLKGFRDALQFLAQMLTPGEFDAAFSSASNFAGGFFEGFMTPIVNFFKSPETQAVLKEILDLLVDVAIRVFQMSDNIFRRITGAFSQAILGGFGTDENGLGPGIASTLVAMLLGPTVIGAVLSAGMKLGVSLISGIMTLATGGGAAAAGGGAAAGGSGGIIARIFGLGGGTSGGGTQSIMNRAGAAVTRIAGRIGSSLTTAAPRLAAASAKALNFLNPAFWIASAALVGKSIGELGDSMREDLTQEFGRTEAETAILTTSLVDTLTLGLLSEESKQSIARGVAELTGSITEALNNMGLSSLVDGMGGLFSALNKTLSGLWDILAGIFTGDGKRISEGVFSMFSGVWDFLKTLPKRVFGNLIELPFAISSFLFKTFLGISSWLLTEGVFLLLKGAKGILDAIVFIIDGIFTFITNPEQRSAMIDSAFEWFSGFTEGITTSVTSVLDALGDFFTKIIDFWKEKLGIQSPSTVALQFGKDFIQGFANGITDLIEAPLEAVKNVANKVIDGFKEILGINSPSTVTSSFGNNLIQGLTNGLSEGVDSLLETVGNISSNVLSIFSEITSVITAPLMGIFEGLASNVTDILSSSFGNLPEIIASSVQPVGDVIRESIISAFSSVGNLSPQLFLDTSNLQDPNQILSASKSIKAIDDVIGLFTSENNYMSNISDASSKLDELNNEFMPRLRSFFENSGEVVKAIEASGVVRLENSLQAGLRELLPAAVAAIETSGADITSGDVSVALAGTTFNINVILKVDGEELAEVTARNLTQR